MRILLFTDCAPTEENYGGPSAFCFHLLNNLQKNNTVKIITTNTNKVPKHILAKSKKIFKGNYIVRPRTLFMKLLVSRKTGALFSLFYNKDLPYISRYKLGHKTLKEIREFSPDAVLIYPSHLLLVCKQLSAYPIFSLGPDCLSLNSLRALKDSYIYAPRTSFKYKKYLDTLKRQIYLERELAKNIKANCLVGLEDSIIFNTITLSNKSVFLPHPHYKLSEKSIKLDKPELKVLISGTYNISTYTDINKMLRAFSSKKEVLKVFSFTFLGKGWNKIIPKLPNSMKVNTIEWVNDYVEEIKKHDIQIFPISHGGGTKGKVLDALAMGLLCVGSYYAFENIAVNNGEHCIIYNDANQIVTILEDIVHNKEKYNSMAELGRESVRKYHNPKLCSNHLIDIIKGKKPNVAKTYLCRNFI